MDLVRGTDPPAFRHRDVDDHCSQTSGGLSGGLSARFPQTVRSGIISHTSNPGHRICRRSRCPLKRDVPPQCGVLVWGHLFSSARPPQIGPLRSDNGETGRRLVRTCYSGTHPQVSLKMFSLKLLQLIQFYISFYFSTDLQSRYIISLIFILSIIIRNM